MARQFLRRHLTIIGIFLITLALVACGGSKAAPTTAPAAANGIPNSFVGAVPGTDAMIALTTTNGTSLSYVCDSKQIASWFKGAVANNALDLTAANGDHLKATLSATGATGTVTLSGKDFPFTAAPSTGDGGLFRAEQNVNGAAVVGGWIISNDGQQRGGVHSAKDNRDEVTPAPQLVVSQKSTAGTWTVTHPSLGPLTVQRVVNPDDHKG